jgi:hypothetical protein
VTPPRGNLSPGARGTFLVGPDPRVRPLRGASPNSAAPAEPAPGLRPPSGMPLTAGSPDSFPTGPDPSTQSVRDNLPTGAALVGGLAL